MTNMMKQDWADDIEEFETQPTPATTTAPEDSDIKTVVEYKTNDEGKKVKVTRKIRMKLVTERVNKIVAERKKWPKFGREAGNKPGPDSATTALGDEVFLKLMSGYKEAEAEDTQTKMRSALKGKNIVCRICKGDHFTTKCPYKDTLQPLQDISGGAEGAAPPAEAEAEEAAAGGAVKGAYVPPHLRGKGGVAAASMEGTRERREDLPTLRITNLSADTQEADLQELCRPGKFDKIVFFPEASDFIACDAAETLQLSQTLDGPFVTRIRSAAQMNGVWISIGVHEVPTSASVEHTAISKVYNSHLLINDQGEIVSVYRKLHLFDVELANRPKIMESDSIKRGNTIVPPVSTPFGSVGLCT
ncbi:translation initiation factor eIF3 subunit g, partial [Dispira parvispora]